MGKNIGLLCCNTLSETNTHIQDNDCMTQSLSYTSRPPTWLRLLWESFFVFDKQINQ